MNFIQDLKIGHRLLGMALLGALFTLAVGFLGLSNMSKVNDMLNGMYDNNLVPIADISNANMQAIYHNRSLYDYVIESDKGEMDRIATKMKQFDARMQELLAKYRKTQLTDKELDALKRFDASWPVYLSAAQKVQGQSYEGNNEEAMKLMNGEATAAFQKSDDLLSELVDINNALGKQAYDESDAVVAGARGVAITMIVLAVAVLVGLALFIAGGVTRALTSAIRAAEAIRDGDLSADVTVTGRDEAGQVLAAMRDMQDSLAKVVGQVRSNSESVATASAQIAQGNQDLSQRTEEQASSLQETAASMEQLGSTVRQNADNARQASQLASSASSVAQQGGAVVGEVVETMRGINESSRKIADIIGTIDGIAFQTNILALNAAVEAARAGEQGRGFAVVAGEVRLLAQRSAEAAKEIKSLIGASVERVEQGTALVDKAGATMSEVVASIQRVTDIMGEISSASTEQSQGVSQVGEAVSQMDQVTQQNAALVEESAAAAESLRGQAQQLVQAVSVFKLAADGMSMRAKPSAPAAARPTAPAPAKAPTAAAKPSAKPVRPVAKAAAPAPTRPAPAPAPADAGDEWTSF